MNEDLTTDEVRDTACPGCGEKALTITMRLRAKPIGTYSLAGQQMKVSAYECPYLECGACGIGSWAK